MPPESGDDVALLNRAYDELDLASGMLLEASPRPPDGDEDRWPEVGDWLLLAHRVDADRVFFVNDDPVLVFSRLPSTATEQDIVTAYRRTWCMSRPRCLFLEVRDELRVYALSQPPVSGAEPDAALAPLQVLRRTADVGEALAEFHRDFVESGAAFASIDRASGSRADQQLLRDVNAVTEALITGGLTRRTAHALIERAVLVRYLEDRAVLTPAYFDAIAASHPSWQQVLAGTGTGLTMGPTSHFVRCLGDRQLTDAVFRKLAADFNGDLFVLDEGADSEIDGEHLRMLQAMLSGGMNADGESLFLWAYDFSIVPTSLVSSMYELFYHQEEDARAASTYYTPSPLVTFILRDVLSETVLERRPRVCDPACGSGVFLAEAFRRMVRYEMQQSGETLSTTQLRSILLERIAGVDTNVAAVRLAAFSLYVAFLDYQPPQDILQAGPLPPLICTASDAPPGREPSPLLVGDAFAEHGDPDDIVPDWWRRGAFDVVVGNPPWTEPSSGRSPADAWAKRRRLPVGDRNLSQLFLWRALELLSDEGVAALLVGAKALLNSRSTSKAFRHQWLQSARLEHVVHFLEEARYDFFEGAKAPFSLVRFRRAGSGLPGLVIYETVRRSRQARGSLAYARIDRRVVSQSALLANDYLWKTYTAGGHHDEALVARLAAGSRLRDLVDSANPPRYGYQRGAPGSSGAREPSPLLRSLRSLRTLDYWGPLREEWFEAVPQVVKTEPQSGVFEGRRLVVSLDVVSGFGLRARVESAPFAFRHNLYTIPLAHVPDWKADIALGVLLSSLGRYWLYMVSGTWGVWFDQVRKEALLDLPLRLPGPDDPSVARIRAAVQALPKSELWDDSAEGRLWGSANPAVPPPDQILATLDVAVADLFEMAAPERDLVTDFWSSFRSEALEPIVPFEPMEGTLAALDGRTRLGMIAYLVAFLGIWNAQIAPHGELSWRLVRDTRTRTVAVVFETRMYDEPLPEPIDDPGAWSDVLARLGESLTRERSAMLRTHGVARMVSDTAIVIVKRDEQRLWTASAAREDAEATTLQAMTLTPS